MNERLSDAAPQFEMPELCTTAEAERRLAELIAMPVELVDELRPQLWDIANRAAATALHPHDKDAIHLTANMLDWELFGQPGDPLPQGLVFTDAKSLRDGAKYGVVPDARLQFGESCPNAGRKQLNSLGLADIQAKVTDVLTERGVEVIKNLKLRLIENPAYIQLQAFDLPLPGAKATEGPLTPHQRLIRAGQLEHEARQVPGGIITHAITPQDGQPYFAIRKITTRLDNETMRLPEQEQSDADARKRAREYFAVAFVDAYLTGAGDGEDHSSERRTQLINELVALGKNCDVLDKAPRNAVLATLTQDMPEGLDKKLAADLLERFANNLFGSAFDTLSYKQLLEVSARAVCGNVYASLRNDHSHVRAFSLRSALLKSYGEYVPADELNKYGMDSRNHNHSISSKAAFREKKGLLEELNQVIGHVASGEVQGNRVIYESIRNRDLPGAVDRADVTLVLPQILYENRDPQIPGYQLMSRDDANNLFSFVKEAADPYTSAKALIPDVEKYDLAYQCEQIGLTELAAGIQRTSQLTIAKLVKLVRANSTYYLPDDQGLVAGTPAADIVGEFRAKVLADFAPLVENGKLLCQCTISDLFMQIALTPTFGKGSLSSINGRAINGQGIITAATHRQTVLNDGVRLYIFDATPPSNELPSSGSAQPSIVNSLSTSLRGLLRQQRAQAPEAPKPDLSRSPQNPLQRIVETGENATLVVAERPKVKQENLLEVTTAVLQRKSRIWLELPADADNETLYARITKLPLSADPLRRTHDIVLRAKFGDVALDEIARFAVYLAHYKDSEAVRRDIQREFGVQPYPKHIIESLENVIADVVHHVSIAANTDAA